MNHLPQTRLAPAFCLLLIGVLDAAVALADHTTPADLTVTASVIRPAIKAPPLGANNFGAGGAIEWAANNFISNSGNEPIYWQYLHRAINVEGASFEIDGPGTSHWDLWGNGLLSGADVRIYRIVDAGGEPLPVSGGYLDLATADHVEFVGPATIIPAGDPDYPAGGWVVTTYGGVYPCDNIQTTNGDSTDYHAVDNDQTYWYTVVAIDLEDNTSAYAGEVSVTPHAGAAGGLHISGDEAMRGWHAGDWFGFSPLAVGGQEPYHWELLTCEGVPQAPPAGLDFDSATGSLSGSPQSDIVDYQFMLRVTDSSRASVTRQYAINPPEPPPVAGSPEPPTNVQAVPGDGYVTVSWDPSPSADVVAYRLLRSVVPAAEQEQRVHLSPGAPPLHPYDYVLLEKRFVNFDMSLVHPRVRGIGNPVDEPNWYWNADLDQVDFTIVPHPEPVPAEMTDPGETCLRIDAQPGQVVMNQYKFIGTDIEGESSWYAYLEPGRQYRAEFWMRQEGLAGQGMVRFDFRPLYESFPYPDIHADFEVTGQWQRFVYDFVAPQGPPPTGVWHYGPALTFTGPGSLWMDNGRVYRWDSVEDRDTPYVPNATVFDEFMAAQHDSGAKGAHRIWFLHHDATMDHILSWRSNPHVNIDWQTRVDGTLEMTLPMGLEFDHRTGDSPETRVRPWLVMQHMVHSEQDWLNLMEYLGAPYDPEVDTPESKPYAYRRYTQRGVGTPWTEEFAEIIIEFGNETWHNGVFEDWIGFHLHGWVHQGGPEYGLFAQYLIDVARSSPYWQSQGLGRKVRFALGGNYTGYVDDQGDVWGYVEEAMQECPEGDYAGHANYVGPKWETGDTSYETFDDHGVQETLVGFLTGVEPNQLLMSAARERLAELGFVYDLAAYEGGPSGYALPGTVGAGQVETSEQYGKSLAMAVACVDGWMRSYRDGWTHQCFLGYGQGTHWNSHTPIQDGFRPSPGWLALSMRNRYAAGHLLGVVENTVPTYERLPGEVLPLAGAYALRNGDDWSVLVVSRKLDGEHDGIDFGDGCTPVTLHLPFEAAEQIELHTLTGDPRESNRFEMKIDIESQIIPAGAVSGGLFSINEFTGGSENGMPPGSIYLYVFHAPGVALPGDCDADGDVDLADLACLQSCYTGPGGTYTDPDCAPADADGDMDVDLADFLIVGPSMTGP